MPVPMANYEAANRAMTFKKLSTIEWEAASGSCDFHVCLTDGVYIVDVFDRFISDPGEAHIAEEQCAGWDDVVAYCKAFGESA